MSMEEGRKPISSLVLDAILLQLEGESLHRAAKVCREWRDRIECLRPVLNFPEAKKCVVIDLDSYESEWLMRMLPDERESDDDDDKFSVYGGDGVAMYWDLVKWAVCPAVVLRGDAAQAEKFLLETPRFWLQEIRLLHLVFETESKKAVDDVLRTLKELSLSFVFLGVIADHYFNVEPMLDLINEHPSGFATSSSQVAYTPQVVQKIIDLSWKGAGIRRIDCNSGMSQIPLEILLHLFTTANFTKTVAVNVVDYVHWVSFCRWMVAQNERGSEMATPYSFFFRGRMFLVNWEPEYLLSVGSSFFSSSSDTFAVSFGQLPDAAASDNGEGESGRDEAEAEDDVEAEEEEVEGEEDDDDENYYENQLNNIEALLMEALEGLNPDEYALDPEDADLADLYGDDLLDF